jgi:glutamine amidotransferase
MQILYERSEEGDVECLGVIPGTVEKISARPGFPVPHMGWNRVRAVLDCELIQPTRYGEEYFYFVHSFAAPAGPAVLANADYGGEIPAVVHYRNWWGVQFHPERSGAAGAKLLEKFIK